ncbi:MULTISPECIES: hypothetical protein [unclassified Sphingomonas]|uniref:hypothetical protein n=1 Tax=unclassified Sphingomonas TaxID=196159 RepID=UPI0012E23909|nr:MULTISPECIES: hypothetical protein [unclassified Sphingomonas]
MMNMLAFSYDDLGRYSPGGRKSTRGVPHGRRTLLAGCEQPAVDGNSPCSAFSDPLAKSRTMSSLGPISGPTPRYLALHLTPLTGEQTTLDKARPARASETE